MVKVWALMKFLILFLIVIFILFAFRFFQKKSDNQTIKNKKDDIVDYNGERTVKGIKEFIEENTNLIDILAVEHIRKIEQHKNFKDNSS